MENIVLSLAVIALFCSGVKSECSNSLRTIGEQGLQNMTSSLSWLGFFEVHRYSKKSARKVSGVILITKSFVIINAEDVASIPYEVFKEKSTVTFIIPKLVLWHIKPIEYHVHPEYKTKTVNTIALIKLDMNISQTNHLLPLCWYKNSTPTKPTNLWVAGYFERNQDLQKFIVSAHLDKKAHCQHIHQSLDPVKEKREPVHYMCLNPKRLRGICKWRSGVALLSNDSNFFSLVGFGIQNSGCHTPPRFIELDQYYTWAAKFFEPNLRNRKLTSTSNNTSYQRETEIKSLSNKSWTYSFVRLDTFANSILVTYKPLTDTLLIEKCHTNIVKYNTNFIHLQYGPDSKAAIYKFTLHDLINIPCTYMKMRIVGLNTTGYTINYCEVIDMGSQEKNPDEELKFDADQDELDHQNSRPAIELSSKRPKIKLYELYLALNYDSSVDLILELYGTKKIPALVLNPRRIKEVMPHDITLARFEWKSVHLITKNENNNNVNNTINNLDIINEVKASKNQFISLQSMNNILNYIKESSGTTNTPTTLFKILYFISFECIVLNMYLNIF